jgi:hypothetical protein
MPGNAPGGLYEFLYRLQYTCELRVSMHYVYGAEAQALLSSTRPIEERRDSVGPATGMRGRRPARKDPQETAYAMDANRVPSVKASSRGLGVLAAVLVAIGLVGALCVLAALVFAPRWLVQPALDSPPTVVLKAMFPDAQVQVMDEVALELQVTAGLPLERVELWADGTLREAREAATSEEDSLSHVRFTWRPDEAGAHLPGRRAKRCSRRNGNLPPSRGRGDGGRRDAHRARDGR